MYEMNEQEVKSVAGGAYVTIDFGVAIHNALNAAKFASNVGKALLGVFGVKFG